MLPTNEMIIIMTLTSDLPPRFRCTRFLTILPGSCLTGVGNAVVLFLRASYLLIHSRPREERVDRELHSVTHQNGDPVLEERQVSERGRSSDFPRRVLCVGERCEGRPDSPSPGAFSKATLASSYTTRSQKHLELRCACAAQNQTKASRPQVNSGGKRVSETRRRSRDKGRVCHVRSLSPHH